MADQPAVGESRSSNGETRVWNGSRWMLTGGSLGPLQMPPKAKPGPWNPEDTATSNEVLKQFLTLGGATAGSALLGPPGTILGGAVGRTLGHIPEALTSAATGRQNTGSFLKDPAIGAIEGATSEIAPPIISGGLRGTGFVARKIGDILGGSPAGGRVQQAIAGGTPFIRAWLAKELGAGGSGELAAAVGPPILSAAGRGMEHAGEAIGTRTLSQRIGDALEGFGGGPSSGDLEALRRSKAAYNWGQGQEIPYRAPSGGGVSSTPTSPSMEALFRNEPPPIAAPINNSYNAERLSTNRAVRLPPEMLQPEELPTHNFQRTQSLAPMKTPQEIGYEGVMRRRGAGLAQAMEGEVPIGPSGAAGLGNIQPGEQNIRMNPQTGETFAGDSPPPLTINDVEIPASLRPFYGTPTLEDQMTRELQTLLPPPSRLPAYR